MNQKDRIWLAKFEQKFDDFRDETNKNFKRINGNLTQAQKDATSAKALIYDHVKDIKAHSSTLNGETGLKALWKIIRIILGK